jgi:hypothetical protein
MNNEDFAFLDSDMPSGMGGMRDEAVERLQNKLGEYNSNWIELENVSYKNT